jgi:hypothetical protein
MGPSFGWALGRRTSCPGPEPALIYAILETHDYSLLLKEMKYFPSIIFPQSSTKITIPTQCFAFRSTRN